MALPKDINNLYKIETTDAVVGETSAVPLSSATSPANRPHRELQENIEYIDTYAQANKDAFEIEHNTDGTHKLNATLVRDNYRNLEIYNNTSNPNYQVDITADELVLQNSTGNALKITSVGLTLNATTSGIGGIDNSPWEETDTWYNVWVIGNGTLTNGVLSKSATAPTMPSGYTYKALVGAIRNNSSGNFIKMYQKDNIVSVEQVQALSSGTASTSTAVDLSSLVPEITKRVSIHHESGWGNGSGNVFAYYLSVKLEIHYGSDTSTKNSFDIICINQEIYYVDTGSTSQNIWVNGWIL